LRPKARPPTGPEDRAIVRARRVPMIKARATCAGLASMRRDGREFLQPEAQPLAQVPALPRKVGDGVAVEDVEERTERFAQRAVEIAIVDQRAAGAAVEAL